MWHILHHGGLFGLQNVVGEDPGHGHLNGELDATAHGELQKELSKPQLGQIRALLQGLWKPVRREWEHHERNATFLSLLAVTDMLLIYKDDTVAI